MRSSNSSRRSLDVLSNDLEKTAREDLCCWFYGRMVSTQMVNAAAFGKRFEGS
jgi:hypothetical protein